MKRYLMQREAERCENAREPACKCRCGGAKHGAGRVSGGDFSTLPMDDPHYRPAMTRKQIVKFLKDACFQMGYPRLANRDEYIQRFGFDAWLDLDAAEHKAYSEARAILDDAITQTKQ